MQHVIAVLFILHPQTNPELRITPDIIVYRAAWFLRGKNQMHAQASSHLRHTD